MERLLEKNIVVTRTHESMTDWALTMKLSEEVGEFNETMLHELGYLLHKKDLEGPMGEAADIIIVLVAALAKHFPEMSETELISTLDSAIHVKLNKYMDLVGYTEPEEYT